MAINQSHIKPKRRLSTSRYEIYEARKRALQNRNLSPLMYTRAVKKIARDLGI